MGAVVKKHRVRRLDKMRAQADLVTHCPGNDPQGGFFAGQLDEAVLQGVDRGVAFFVVHVVLDGGVDDCLVDDTVSRLSWSNVPG